VAMSIVVAALAELSASSQFGALRLDDAAVRSLIIDRVERQKRAPGIVVGIVDRNRARLTPPRLASNRQNRPATRKTLFELRAIPKVVTGTAVARLARRGVLTLDDPLSRWVPELADRRSIEKGYGTVPCDSWQRTPQDFPADR